MTRTEKRQAEAAIYGHQEHMSPNLTNFTRDEIERMRAILAQHDNQQPQVAQEFDLNAPAKEPYVYQPYPKVMYHHGRRTERLAHTPEDAAAAIETGWSLEPYPADGSAPTVELDAASSAEAAEMQARLNRALTKSRK